MIDNNKNKYNNNNGNEPKPFFRPSNKLESTAMFLEETLEKFQRSERYWLKQLKFSKDATKKAEVQEKLKEVRRGLVEVSNKANNVWMEIKNAH